MNTLLTGGAGYIGSHTAIKLSQAGHEVVIFDNFSNSSRQVIVKLRKILGKSLRCIHGDVRDTSLVVKTLSRYKIDSVIHFAGLKAVNESVQKPLTYYSNNVQGTISLVEALQYSGIRRLIFSSSATVYGDPKYLPIDEMHPVSPTNPYGQSKLQIEQILRDLSISDKSWNILCLRYFNPVGAHDSGLIGEAPNGTPNNLLPYLAQVACGMLPELNIFGADYPTPDGTGIRDYIHVMDIAEGHLAALAYVFSGESRRHSESNFDQINLGTGKGYSVLEMIDAYQKASAKKIPYQVISRRQGDIGSCIASVDKAFDILRWKSSRNLDEMCISSWNFQKKSVN